MVGACVSLGGAPAEISFILGIPDTGSMQQTLQGLLRCPWPVPKGDGVRWQIWYPKIFHKPKGTDFKKLRGIGMDFTSKKSYLDGEHVTKVPSSLQSSSKSFKQVVTAWTPPGLGIASLMENNMSKYRKSCLKKSNACQLLLENLGLVFGTYDTYVPSPIDAPMTPAPGTFEKKSSKIQRCGFSTAIFND